jgi:hypothetical protein
VLGLAYQDLRGNQEAEVLVAPIRFDNATLPLSVSTPVSGTRLALETEVTVTIPEQALGGSVQVLFDPSFATYGGTDDSAGGQRVLVLVRVGWDIVGGTRGGNFLYRLLGVVVVRETCCIFFVV